jgi:hypothetical protein
MNNSTTSISIKLRVYHARLALFLTVLEKFHFLESLSNGTKLGPSWDGDFRIEM